MGLVVDVPHPTRGSIPMVRAPLNFSGAGNCSESWPPFLAQDTAAVLARLGYSEAQIAELAAKGAVKLGAVPGQDKEG